MTQWNNFYSDQSIKAGTMWYPDEQLIRFISQHVQKRVGIDEYRTRAEVKTVLDAGCGNGCHVIFMAGLGFDTYGIDVSPEGIKTCKDWLIARDLKATVEIGNVIRLPYKNELFDLVISAGVLDHLFPREGEQAIAEIERVLKPGGFLYLTLRTTPDSDYDAGHFIAKDTIEIQEGAEAGLPQHFYPCLEYLEPLKHFDILSLERHRHEIHPNEKEYSRWYLWAKKQL